MKYLGIILLIITVNTLSAQTRVDALIKFDTLLYHWIPRGAVGLDISQVAFSDWSQGGENSLSWLLNGAFGLNYFTRSYSFVNTLKLAYGQTKLGSQESRTNDNELFLEDLYSYNVGWVVEPYISNTVRTNLGPGYNYSVTPAVQVADFFDPGYVNQGFGFAYNRNKYITTRVGLGLQEIFTNKYRRYSDDTTTTDKVEAFKFETGLESVTSFAIGLGQNLLFSSYLRLFTRFKNLDTWDVRWDNTLAAQVNKYVSVKLNVLTIYDKTQSLKTQTKEALLLGISYVLF